MKTFCFVDAMQNAKAKALYLTNKIYKKNKNVNYKMPVFLSLCSYSYQNTAVNDKIK